MKKYIAPAMELNEAQANTMMAVSLAINGETTVNGSEALTKEETDWAIWED